MIFLRPWLLLLIIVPIALRLFRERVATTSDWRKVIDKKLLPYLLVRGKNDMVRRQRLYKLVLWIALVIAAAGPAWYKLPVPSRTEQPGTVIILELTPAMTGEWLDQARRKIQDILTALKGEQVALVLYDRFGYTAGPLTFDTDILRDMVPYLDQGVLQEQTSDPIAGFRQADRLLKNAGITAGRILFLTTGASVPDDLAEQLQNNTHHIGILGVGPAEARPIPLKTGGF